jgi:hypothetical protein
MSTLANGEFFVEDPERLGAARGERQRLASLTWA